MPTYEYLCQTCSHRFETWQKMTDEPLTVCPECGNHIRRVLFPAGVVFKGSGFYKTDHAAGKAAAIPPGHTETKPSEGASEGKNGSDKNGSEQKSSESNKSDGSGSSSSSPSSTTSPTPAK